MSLESVILIVAWGLMIALLVIFVPRNKIREAQVIFLFKQLMTWIFGLIVAELGLIEYPVRVFSYASRASFTFEFFIYPSLCVIFNLHYPENKRALRQLGHYVLFCSAITVVEVLCERFTNIIHYVNWTWYTTWFTLLITFYLSRLYYIWFFRKRIKKY